MAVRAHALQANRAASTLRCEHIALRAHCDVSALRCESMEVLVHHGASLLRYMAIDVRCFPNRFGSFTA